VWDKTFENLRVHLAFPAGVDRVGQPVVAAGVLEPGKQTAALWTLVPVYTDGAEIDFVLVLEADNLPRTVIRTRGPRTAVGP